MKRTCTICKTLKSRSDFGPFGCDNPWWCYSCIAIARSITEKKCSKCRNTKKVDCFGPNRFSKDGLRSACNPCRRRAQQARRDQKPQKESEYNKTPRGRFRHYIGGAKSRGLVFDLTFKQFKLFWQKPCSYCGAEIETIGLDRTNNSKGYTLKNITSCCFGCNTRKGGMRLKEWNAWRYNLAISIMEKEEKAFIKHQEALDKKRLNTLALDGVRRVL